MHVTSSNVDLPPTRDSFLYNVTTPKHNHKLIAQVHVERQVGNYAMKLHAINPKWYLNINPLSKKLAERLLSRCKEQSLTPLTHVGIACELLGLDSSKTAFFKDSCVQKATVNISGTSVEISIDSLESVYPMPPDKINVNVDSEQMTLLRFSKSIDLLNEGRCSGCKLGEYAIKQQLSGGGFSKIFLARNTSSNMDFAIEVVDLTKNKDEFERSRAVFTQLQSSDYIVKLHEAFVLPASQVGCLVEDIAHADMMYTKDLFREGLDDCRMRVVSKQLLEIINDLDQHHVLHDKAEAVDFLYFKMSGKIKVGALERASLEFNKHNSLRVVSEILDSLVWDHSESKKKPDWLSKEMFDFMNEIRHSNAKAESAMTSEVFQEIANQPKLVVAIPDIDNPELSYI